ncbi:hypothetical protein KKF84_21655 [Myxococcota bacterium]|nr:hypothetical protein [Myxococcota bacterium]MBU1537933.1 hypothetical protein [Myxococcota bacterium]
MRAVIFSFILIWPLGVRATSCDSILKPVLGSKLGTCQKLTKKERSCLAGHSLNRFTFVKRVDEKSIEEEENSGFHVKAQCIINLASLASLGTLHISAPMQEDVLRYVNRIKGLHTIIFDETNTKDVHMAKFRPPSGLRRLSFKDKFITDKSLKSIGKCKKLTHLDLSGTEITGRGFYHLSGLTSLESLAVRELPLEDAAWAVIGKMRTLRILDANHSGLNDASFMKLTGLSHLRTLKIAGADLSSASCKLLAAFPLLTHLQMSGSSVTDAAMIHLAAISGLTYLDLSSKTLTDKGLAYLSRLAGIKTLLVHAPKVKGTALASMASLPISKLAIHLNDVGCSNMGTMKLKRLAVTGAVTEYCLEQIAKISNLEALTLKNTAITDSGLLKLRAHPTIRRLTISGGKISASGIAALKKQLPRLKTTP